MSKVFWILSELAFFVGFLVIFIFNFNIKSKLDKIEYHYALSLSSNWVSAPITNITLGPFCDKDSSLLTFDQWEGTQKGCLCSSGSTYVGNFCRCGKRVRCKRYSEISPKAINTWHSARFCVSRMNVSSYLALTIGDNKTPCANGMINCGQLDDYGNFLCVPSSQKCPINDIVVLKEFDTIPNGYSTINVTRRGEKKVIAFGNKGQMGKILAEFKISENRPCADPFYVNRVTNSHLFEMTSGRDRCITPYANRFLDYSYQFVDTTLLYDVYSENSILMYVRDVLPGYRTTQLQMPTNLYYRNYIGLSKRCHDEIQQKGIFRQISDGFVYVNNNFEDTKDLYGAIYIYVIVVWCVVLVFHHIGVIAVEIVGKGDATQTCCQSFMLFFTFFCFLVVMVLYCVFFGKINDINSSISSFLLYVDCGDPVFTQAVGGFIKNLDELVGNVRVCMIISLCIFLNPILTIILKFCCDNCCESCCQKDDNSLLNRTTFSDVREPKFELNLMQGNSNMNTPTQGGFSNYPNDPNQGGFNSQNQGGFNSQNQGGFSNFNYSQNANVDSNYQAQGFTAYSVNPQPQNEFQSQPGNFNEGTPNANVSVNPLYHS